MSHLTIAFLFAVLLYAAPAKSQTDSITQQINEQVWLPYINTFNNMYTEGFMDLHSKKLIRIPEENKRILNYADYFENIKRSNDAFKKVNFKQSIELRFLNRFEDGDNSFETGFYKTVFTQNDGTKKISYGKFYMLLHKEKDIWKITFDTDAPETVDEALFETGKLLK